MSEANNKYPLIIESKSNYAYVLKRKKQLSFNAIRNASNVFYNQLPIEIRNELHQQILRGTCQLDNETELNAYMHDMSLMHNAKLRDAFSHLSTIFFGGKEIDIIDYGCGQAMGCISYADYLKENNHTQNVRRITLIEPSYIALARAALHSSLLFPNAEIVTINKGFDDLTVSDIEVDSNIPTLHIFSNVLDMGSTPNYNGVFNLGTFSNLVLEISKGYNEYVITEPLFSDFHRDEQADIFTSSLGINVYYERKCNTGEFVANKTWTCVIKCGCVGLPDVKVSSLQKDSWTWHEFRRLYGKPKLAPFKNESTNELYKKVVFIDESNKANKVYVKFSRLHGELSADIIKQNKDNILICQKTNYRGEKYYELELVYDSNSSNTDGISLETFFKIYGKPVLAKLGDRSNYGENKLVVYLDETDELNDLFLRHRNLYKELFADTIRKNSDKIKIYQRGDANGDKYFELVFNINFIPNNEIWYETTDNKKLEFTNCPTDRFGANIVSHTYNRQIGILKFDNSLRIINSAFFRRRTLSRIYLPDEIEEIRSDSNWRGAFCGCIELLGVILPSKLHKIGSKTFYGCIKLDHIRIPNNVEFIGDGAFGNCYNLQTFSGKYAEDNGKSLIVGDILCSFAAGSGETEYTIPNKVSTIGSSAFSGCKSLQYIHIHNQVKEIMSSAFRNCSNLMAVNIPTNVTKIEYATFAECGNLKAITIHNNIVAIEQLAFEGCSSLEKVTIPDSVTLIGEEAFKNCENLSEVHIGTGVKNIGNSVFIGCHSLKLFKGKYVSDDGCSLIFDNKLISFAPFSKTQYDIPQNVTEICWCVFKGCTHLAHVTMPDNIIAINQSVFEGCEKLDSITIPSSIKGLIPCAISNINTVYCKAIIPPTAMEHCHKCSKINFEDTSKVIYVPYQSYDRYISDPVWKQFHNRLQPYDYENNMVHQRH